jgi:hypothetical protein
MMNAFIAGVVVLVISAVPGLADMVGQGDFVAPTLIDFEGVPSRPIVLNSSITCTAALVRSEDLR